jgi:hypothetical protein
MAPGANELKVAETIADVVHQGRTVCHMPRLLLALIAVLAAVLVGAASVRSARGPVVANTDPVVSPGGESIAYWRDVGGARRASLMVMRANGTQKRRIATAVGREAAWSPDGKLIAYADPEITVVPAAGGVPRRLSHEWVSGVGPQSGLTGLRWLDAQTIEYGVNDCCIVGGASFTYSATVTLDGTQTDNQSELACDRRGCAAVSPDGTRSLTVEAHADGSNYIQLSGAGLAQPVDLGPGCCAAWSPGGRYIRWEQTIGKHFWNTIAHADGSNPTLITWQGKPVASGELQWSDIEDALAFTGPLSGKAQLWVADADGSHARPVTHEPRGVSNAYLGGLWSSHGRWLVYGRASAGGQLRTIAEHPDGSGTHSLIAWQIPFSNSNPYQETWASLRWGPGDSYAVYYDRTPHCPGTSYAVYRVETATGATRRLTGDCGSG